MITRARTILSPAYGELGSVKFHLSGPVTANPEFETSEISDSLGGTVDEVVKNRMWRATMRPLYYDTTNTLSLFWPWISLASTPVGTLVIGSTSSTASIVGSNGDTILLEAAGVTKMPDLFLGVESEFYASDMEITGLGVSGDDPATSSSWMAISTGNSFSVPTIPSSTLARQKYTAAWGSFGGFTAFQAFKGFQISHELKLQPQYDNGQLIDFSIVSYRAMAKCIASGNTMAQLITAMAFQSTGAAQGQQLSAQSADLVISGAASVTVTLKAAAIRTAGFKFSGTELRQGEIGFVSTNIGATAAGLTLA